MSRLARATVSASALRHNLGVARRAAGGASVFAVLKANAYGHGLLAVADGLAEVADGFAVACLDEALPLREAGHARRLLVMEGAFSASELNTASRHNIDLAVHSAWQMELLAAHPPRRPLDIWLKINSGMNRLGVWPWEASDLARRLASMPAVARVHLMTHLAEADDRGAARTPEQLRVFEGIEAPSTGYRSAANSAATLGWPEAAYDWVRPGIALYGASPFIDGGSRPDLRPAMTLEARVIAVRQQRRNDAVGYGGRFVCPEDMPVGIVSIGYGDGYPRHAPDGTPALIRGQRAALAGRVSMDMLTLDLRGCGDVAVGDAVTLWGDGLPAEGIAERCDTIAYELFCQITSRVRFRYI